MNFVSINCSGCFLLIACENTRSGGGRGIIWSLLLLSSLFIDVWSSAIISWTFGKIKSLSSWHNSKRIVGLVFKGVIFVNDE